MFVGKAIYVMKKVAKLNSFSLPWLFPVKELLRWGEIPVKWQALHAHDKVVHDIKGEQRDNYCDHPGHHFV